MNRTEILASGIQKTTFSNDGTELASVIKHLDIPTNQWITKVYINTTPAGLTIAEAKELSSALQTIAIEVEHLDPPLNLPSLSPVELPPVNP